ncbi:MAG: tRNA (uridine(34)/cytosine(34)/5-carboxymethylaminomethyluridine(34)-2'-O)-methyltransferase TrmL [Anaeromicrobium sp.]|jgi:tRNA (cytidine/uridine-2'-O-)-methyltransferase|uniref:tRNA (uridine(34)/cytosine(34)/5- carboxymethylaminomethyluridine(34)-2'-O)- methyltransferase TrmL n=1 Tax=Anaeromicrobium sp. TaxID=1929132 RepID=UPI0025CBF564|nr:tRNA (uridine(34)/cytosine(34)/5-carboxymethylaminomethyluridine(34)-2'-O)-methyltransferase TrmL [Anaeromicrobium sp.]MCT4593504.1 tRNA (uridine(34)/cytosine(34)/5-carboxymethylaminomethyluridine(34)-2'-O)-methyltransferase TrmL [Anaeromicrobium sp.]
MPVNVVLYQPEIPPNTGTIARTCAATGTSLHLIKPLGFSIEDKHLKRAGLDYWYLLDLHIYENVEEFFEKNKGKRIYFGTTKAKSYYTDMNYEEDCFIMFGKETAGIPMDILNKHMDTCIKIPMVKNEKARSLNLSNSVNIVLYEVLRQIGFRDLI